MDKKDSFISEVSNLLNNYKEEEFKERCTELNDTLEKAKQVPQIEINPNYGNIEYIKIGRRVSIVRDGKHCFLKNNTTGCVYCPRLKREDIEREFEEQESINE